MLPSTRTKPGRPPRCEMSAPNAAPTPAREQLATKTCRRVQWQPAPYHPVARRSLRRQKPLSRLEDHFRGSAAGCIATVAKLWSTATGCHAHGGRRCDHSLGCAAEWRNRCPDADATVREKRVRCGIANIRKRIDTQRLRSGDCTNPGFPVSTVASGHPEVSIAATKYRQLREKS